MKKYILMFGLTLVMGLFIANTASSQGTPWLSNPTLNHYNLGIGSLATATGAQAIDVFRPTVSNIRITRDLSGDGPIGRFQIVNAHNNSQLVMVLRRQGGVNEMIQSANSPTHGFLEYLYLNLDNRKYEIREGIGLTEWKNTGHVLFNNVGAVGIGVSEGDVAKLAGAKLGVNGKIVAEEIEVKLLASWPDFVFNKDYSLMPLNELESFVTTNKHLPGVPSEAAISAQGGFNLGETSIMLLQKVEELTLYIIELNKRIEELEK
jgi:hypothetical protein